MDPTPNGLKPEWTHPRRDPTPKGLDHEWTELRMDSTPKGLNPNWDSTPNELDPDWDSTLTWLNSEWDSTSNSSQPRMALFHCPYIEILQFSLNMNQSVPISKEWISKHNTIIFIINTRITEELQKDSLHKNQTKKLFFTAVEIVPFEVERNSRLSPVRC